MISRQAIQIINVCLSLLGIFLWCGWAKRNPRFHFHFTPTSASWLNMVERFFRDLSDKAIKRGSFYNVDDLIGAITEYINQHNQNPKPFIWTASAKDILAKVKRARAAMNKS